MELVSGTFAIDLSFVEAARREKDTEKRAEKLHRAQQANMHIEQTWKLLHSIFHSFIVQISRDENSQ